MDTLSSWLLTAEEWEVLRLSLKVSIGSACAVLPLAVLLGYLLVRKDFAGKWLLEVLIDLPLVIPPVVTGYLLLICFGPRGPIGHLLLAWFGLRIAFTWLGALLASAVMSFPLMVRAMRLAFESLDPRLEMAARGLGAGRWTTFRTISLPLVRRGLVAAWLLGFARSLGEFGATIMIAGNIEGRTRTIPLAIYTYANRPGGMDEAWRLVGLSILLACAALAVSELLERRRRRYAPA